jgi:C4-dicarboxylate transporter, DctM subunit
VDHWLLALLTISAVVLILVGTGMWTGVALGLAAVLCLTLLTNFPVVNAFASVAFSSLDGFGFTALPLFILMGEIMFRSGASDQLYSGLSPWVAKIPGRLLHSNVLACTIFAAVSGSSAATAATIGSIAVPELKRRGYDEGAVIGSLCGAGTLGLLIPPSLAMIVYGGIVGESIGQLFIAGILPGLVLASLFMIYIATQGVLRPEIAPAAETYGWGDRWAGLARILPMGAVIFLVLGLIYLGVSTATEAAAVGVFAAVGLSVLQKRFSWRMYWASTMAAVKITAMISFIVASAAALAVVVASLRIPQELMANIAGAQFPPLAVMAIICLIYVALGALFDGLAMQILTLPVVYPLVKAMGYDGIWFGIVLVVLIELAQITPPVGLNLFVLRNISGWSIERIALVSIPYMLILLLELAILFVFPGLATWLPQQMAK